MTRSLSSIHRRRSTCVLMAASALALLAVGLPVHSIEAAEAEPETISPETPPENDSGGGPGGAAPQETKEDHKEDNKIEVPPPPPPSEPAPEPPKVAEPPPAPPVVEPVKVKPAVTAKFTAELYGFVEFDAILDSTQALNETAGNGVLAKDGTFAATHSRLTYTGRNSRIGLKLKGPETDLLRASAILEMDFLGNQPSPVSEAALFTNPTFRFRHMALKMETPAVDILAGQSWQLFGWQSYFHPNTVEIQGVPGEIYSRALQLRVSHAFKLDVVTLDLAVAAARPPQRDGARPDVQGGVRLVFNRWKVLHTSGSTGTAVDPGGIGVSGDFRVLRPNEFSAMPAETRNKLAGGVSIDALIPIVPGTLENRGDALTLTGSFVQGTGIADLYSGLNGGIAFPALPNPQMASPAPTYVPNIDPGLVIYTSTGELHTIDWQSFIVGAQYYLPPSGRVWISGNFSQLKSTNIDQYATGSMAPNVFKRSRWADGNLFVDLSQALRVGAEVAWSSQLMVDESSRHNWRLQTSAFYIF